MIAEAELVHERTLIGAVDSFLKELVHVRPHLFTRYSDVLETMAEQWIEQVDVNSLDALEPRWLGAFIAAAPDRGMTMCALQDFYRWAQQNKLTIENPLGGVLGE